MKTQQVLMTKTLLQTSLIVSAPKTSCGLGATHSYITSTPIIAQKPYIIEANGKYTLFVLQYETKKAVYSLDGEVEDEI